MDMKSEEGAAAAGGAPGGKILGKNEGPVELP
jgi:hypothetical protein